jgi:hypothetical protein
MTNQDPPPPLEGDITRSDPTLIVGALMAAGSLAGPPLAVLTDHWLNGGQGEPESSAPQIELPPGVNVDEKK